MVARNILVTGGSDGIGLAIAGRFAKAGANVVIVHKMAANSDVALRKSGARCAIAADLSTPAGIDGVTQHLDEQGVNVLDVLVNNAGIRIDPLSPSEPIAAHYDRAVRIVATNLLSSYLLIVALAERLCSPGGRVINITSRAAYIGGDPIYAAAKAGLASLQVSLVETLGQRGITINSVSPGFVPDTGMFRGRINQCRIDEEIQKSPIRRVGSVEDVARLVEFIAAPESGYITGQSFKVDGGATRGLG